MRIEKIKLGWEEWCSLPELGISTIKAKVDTGAASSALHAENITLLRRKQRDYVQFAVQPLSGEHCSLAMCTALLHDQRIVISSNGQKEKRYVIETQMVIANVNIPIELTLTNRHLMRFNLLIGRQALKQFAIIDPAKSYCQGKPVVGAIKK